MSAKLSLLALVLTSSAFAQIDSYGLRAKYGTPLNRETYDVPPGVRIVVDYGPSARACRIEVTPLVQANAPEVTKPQLDAVVAELVPAPMRGKELGRMMEMMGLASVSIIEYEHLTISEPRTSNHPNSMIVSFKTEECKAQPVH